VKTPSNRVSQLTSPSLKKPHKLTFNDIPHHKFGGTEITSANGSSIDSSECNFDEDLIEEAIETLPLTSQQSARKSKKKSKRVQLHKTQEFASSIAAKDFQNATGDEELERIFCKKYARIKLNE